MFNDKDNGQTQYCPMCEEWAEKCEKYKNFLEWLLKQQYYILNTNLKNKIKAVLEDTKS